MKIQLNNVPISDNDNIIEPQSEETNPGSSRVSFKCFENISIRKKISEIFRRLQDKVW